MVKDGSIRVFLYDKVSYIQLLGKNEDKVAEVQEPVVEMYDLQNMAILEDSKEKSKEKKESSLAYRFEDLYEGLNNLSVFNVTDTLFEESILYKTPLVVRRTVFSLLEKEKILPYTLLNIIPGVGSLVQGDYIGAAYVLASVVGAIIYNAAGGFGTDYALAINLNMILAYLSSFTFPTSFNKIYNDRLRGSLAISL